ncbi:hypothetical protein PAXRUDRAFT_672547 [Paxillus rubicundulus Ve08.2h10]|uniref:Uncharacterized protein n=1 Tax=Paxillus rubicundulus Ve08.2h10 TaxID=930991 RepID=A0A0D0E1R9_9AGAM|nr:hypothetical protein PAXRUDRAFT_672547 [Paxillus rubicundulus Ve08.2h10]
MPFTRPKYRFDTFLKQLWCDRSNLANVSLMAHPVYMVPCAELRWAARFPTLCQGDLDYIRGARLSQQSPTSLYQYPF